MECRRYCKGCRIETKKLILLIGVITTIGAVLESFVIPYPVSIIPFNTLNRLEDSLSPQARFEQFPSVSIAPDITSGPTSDTVLPINSLNSSESLVIELEDLPKGGDSGILGSPNSLESQIPKTQVREKVNSSSIRSGDYARGNDFPKVEESWKGEATQNRDVEERVDGLSAKSEGLLDGKGDDEALEPSDSLNELDPNIEKVDKPIINNPPEREDSEELESLVSRNRMKSNPGTIKVVESPKIVTAPSQIAAASNGSASSRSKRPPPIWSLPPEQALAYAKIEIDNAPIVTDDPDLYPPVFRNVSRFKRSYELMERILKVYIYPDGPRPIFHRPPLKGIYASEGWFMKLMEESKQFVVRDPNKAHLFYLPYSSRQLQLSLYVPDSHDMRPLSYFLRDYVNMIAAKYPFWNRSHGSDHFLVACHDWGPYTTKEHDELRQNTIKALCNADLSEGFFVPGKDVSLPETTIRTPKRPLRQIGGRPISQRPILAFFAGYMHGRVRPILLKYWGDKDDDMKIYGPLPNKISTKMTYVQHMKSSKYCICPMGFEVNSPRIVESIYYECVPIIIADNFVPPFDDVLNWKAFAVFVAEKDIPNLKNILLAIPLRQYISMQNNVKRVQRHFLWHSKPIRFDLFHMILHSIWYNRLNQISSG
ncbi:probable glycosyltransferase At5g03795 [Amborella trichopoda]|uniref:Exostosin GT47 domain-containing protein n=1 Tax=Amborella trichopoda TaxID=13333 RepID=W1NZL9_AMBTC|nr:probable glycosyltransferase At5g03795 [Amborella trichopoda]XP_020519329.1 probable glycosyltransferase At5g03795 [Amborella trichopoda]XP_020519330.1 probable glycosyltransferase At5g03795 [Amborella trichopoda]XP_020519331.1 probable glycosyltransferase At5g03795 [Amborella trichopoda]XP_020519332.1 probable glycosyltransferase At5g03795 [Amborella trichopoda]XP_020519333.1 probable glycosyltransferase At5g03795 [Amborella trichopoda]XP_020519334.1 probable glycosyltransferase At5g03795|eukprot:XP_020519328.1 probable glycosyltransferase At5g03795 [Amborella trichopoda]